MLRAADVRASSDHLVALLAAIDSGEVEAAPMERAFIEGGLTVARQVLDTRAVHEPTD